MTRKYLIAGNWKMNAGGAKGIELGGAVAAATRELAGKLEIVVAPPFTTIAAVAAELEGSHVEVAGQIDAVDRRRLPADVEDAFGVPVEQRAAL